MRIYAVVNLKAGAAIDLTPQTFSDEIRQKFHEAGHDITVNFCEPDAIGRQLDECAAKQPDAIIVGGGDGTIRCAAQRLLHSGIALGILPLGTLNRLARDLNIPLQASDAIEALARGTFRYIDVAEVNGRVFLNNSFIGLPSKISAERQKLRGETLRTRTGGYLRLMRDILASRAKLDLSVNDDNTGRKLMRVLSLAVSNNPYNEEPSLVLTRGSLDSGELGLYISKHHSGLRLFGVLIRAAFGGWDGDPNLDRITAKRIAIHMRRRQLRLSNDGEVEILEPPLHYSIHPKALKLLVPAAAAS